MESLGQGKPSFAPYHQYWLYDTFSINRAYGEVHGTLADGVGGIRTLVDPNGAISIIGELEGQGYYVYDKFTVNCAPGSVSTLEATPIGGTRHVIDTNSKISIIYSEA